MRDKIKGDDGIYRTRKEWARFVNSLSVATHNGDNENSLSHVLGHHIRQALKDGASNTPKAIAGPWLEEVMAIAEQKSDSLESICCAFDSMRSILESNVQRVSPSRVEVGEHLIGFILTDQELGLNTGKIRTRFFDHCNNERESFENWAGLPPLTRRKIAEHLAYYQLSSVIRDTWT